MKLRKLLSMFLCAVLLLGLLPTAALAEEPAGIAPAEEPDAAAEPRIEPLADGNVPVYIVDDSTGGSPEHGSVTLLGYTFQSGAEFSYRVTRGDQVTVAATPEEGYALTDLHVTYKRTSSSSDVPLQLDESNAFVVPSYPSNSLAITIHATFASINNDYVVDVYVNDGDTGNTVTADRDRAREGDLVTLTVDMAPGTRFLSPGLTVHGSGSGPATVELTQLDSSTYSFLMPACDVTVSAFFEFIEYSVTNLLSDVPFEELRFQLTVDKTAGLHCGETVTVTTMTYDELLIVTPLAYYEADGETVYLTLTEDTAASQGLTRVYSFTMPACDVTVTAEHGYQGYHVGFQWLDPDGEPVDRDKAQPSFSDENGESLAQNNFYVLPGSPISFHIRAYDIPDCGVQSVSYSWERDGESFEGSFTELDYDRSKNASGSFVMPEGDVTFTIVQDKAYYVNFEGENGTVSADLHKAFPGETVTVTATVTDSAYDHLIWETSSEGVTFTEVEGQPNVRQFVMPEHDVGLKVRFTMQPVPYIERSWDGSRVVETEEECLLYNKLSSGLIGGQVLVDGWYVVEGPVSIGKLLVLGDAHLILPDGAMLNAAEGVSLFLGAKLTIHGQTGDSGTLYTHPDGVGIGGSGELIVQGGSIDAQGSSDNAAIGSAEGNDQSLIVTINGGSVTAVGGYQGAGIGGGSRYDGVGANGGVVSIHGGTVTAVGGEEGAGIGGGYMGRAGDITITGGRVNATGGKLGAAIGSGYIYVDTDHNDCVGQHITITGGKVYANTNGNEAAAIGGGCGGSSGTIVIRGGYVQASSGTLAATIGGGNGGGCNEVRIEGGTVIASGGGHRGEDIGAIGRGYSEGSIGIVTIYSDARVTAGETASSAQPVAASEKWNACTLQNYVKIEPCPHDALTYTVTADAHTKVCPHCSTAFVPEAHHFDDHGVCTVCGYQGEVYTISFDPNGGSGTMESLCCVPGRELMLPVCSFTAPEGLCFAGWQLGDDPALKGEEERIVPEGDLVVKAVWYYPITILDAENGSVTMTGKGAFEGDTVILTVTPEEGYVLDSLSVTEEHGGSFPLTKIDDSHYSFVMPDCPVTVAPSFCARALEDGFYLIGPDWTLEAISPENKFEENPNAAGEYMLETSLAIGDEIKVVRVENGAITGWWPDGLDTQYHVDEAHSGDVTIYFKTSYDNAWSEFGGYFYIGAALPPAARVEIFGCSLSLKGNIAINIYVVPTAEFVADPDAYVMLNGVKTLFSEATTRQSQGETLYEFQTAKNAKEMNDAVTLRVYDGNDELVALYRRATGEDITDTGFSVSIMDYILITQQTSSNAKLLALVNAMSDYGSLAQVQFDYETDQCAEVMADLSAVTLETLAPYEAQLTEGTATGVAFAGSSLLLKSETILRFYFTVSAGEVTDYSFTIGGETVTPVKNGNYWYVEVANIAAKDLDETYTITVSSAEGTVLTLKASALSYAYTNLKNSTDTKMINLVKGLYLYNKAANEYFA